MNIDELTNMTNIIRDLVNEDGERYDELYELLEDAEYQLEDAVRFNEPVQFRIYYNRQSDAFYNTIYRDAFYSLVEDEALIRRDSWSYSERDLVTYPRLIRIEDDILDIIDKFREIIDLEVK